MPKETPCCQLMVLRDTLKQFKACPVLQYRPDINPRYPKPHQVQTVRCCTAVHLGVQLYPPSCYGSSGSARLDGAALRRGTAELSGCDGEHPWHPRPNATQLRCLGLYVYLFNPRAAFRGVGCQERAKAK